MLTKCIKTLSSHFSYSNDGLKIFFDEVVNSLSDHNTTDDHCYSHSNLLCDLPKDTLTQVSLGEPQNLSISDAPAQL